MPKTTKVKLNTKSKIQTAKIADNEARKMITKYVGETRHRRVPKRRVVQMWKNRMNNLLARCILSQTITSQAGLNQTWKLNAVNTVGPRTNNTGAFAGNCPAGLFYGLSSDASSGAIAIYERYVCYASRLILRITSAGANTVGWRVAIYPSTSLSNAATSYDLAAEQPFAVTRVVPALTQGSDIVLSNEISVSKLMGVKPAAVTADDTYSGSAVSDPLKTCYWHVYCISTDGSTNINYAVQTEIVYLFDLYDRNTFTSSVPA